jgi:hypothetical protein
MSKKKWITLGVLLVVSVCAGIALVAALGQTALAAPPPPQTQTTRPNAAGDYIILAWNDLGMHCYNPDFADLAVLPPYNTLWAQVIRVGDPPQIITTGITISYAFPDNTYSVGKSNFWTYAQKIFGLSAPLPANVGLTGKKLADVMDPKGDHFEAAGIPLTEYRDSDLNNRYPFQLATITVKDASTNVVLRQTQTVAPVSTEMRCDNCHADTGDATTRYPITPTGKVDTNILALHDYLSQSQYPAGHTGPLMGPARRPVLCAECHSSNALGAPGVTGISSLSNAMHNHHKDLPDITPDTAGCYNCHPGPTTRCLRDVMSQRYGMTCVNCHGTMQKVAQNTSPWLNEPRCDDCHGEDVRQDQALYRHSKGHGAVYCEGCHDSTHAIATSREPNDAIKFVNLQGEIGTLHQCTVCHATQPTDTFSHQFVIMSHHIYLPSLIRN